MDEFIAGGYPKLILDRLKPILYNFYATFFNSNMENCIGIRMEAHYSAIPEYFIRQKYGSAIVTFNHIGRYTYNFIIKDIDHEDSWSRIK